MHFREEEKQAENRWRLFLKISIELSVYIYIKKVAEKEALLRRGDAIADFYFQKKRVCVSEQSLFLRSAPYKSDRQHQEKDKRTSYNQQGVFNVIESTILQSDVFLSLFTYRIGWLIFNFNKIER